MIQEIDLRQACFVNTVCEKGARCERLGFLGMMSAEIPARDARALLAPVNGAETECCDYICSVVPMETGVSSLPGNAVA